MGRRELRAEVQRTWSVYEPRVPGTPFSQKDIHDADERAERDGLLPVATPEAVARFRERVAQKSRVHELLGRAVSQRADEPDSPAGSQEPDGAASLSSVHSGVA